MSSGYKPSKYKGKKFKVLKDFHFVDSIVAYGKGEKCFLKKGRVGEYSPGGHVVFKVKGKKYSVHCDVRKKELQVI